MFYLFICRCVFAFNFSLQRNLGCALYNPTVIISFTLCPSTKLDNNSTLYLPISVVCNLYPRLGAVYTCCNEMEPMAACIRKNKMTHIFLSKKKWSHSHYNERKMMRDKYICKKNTNKRDHCNTYMVNFVIYNQIKVD